MRNYLFSMLMAILLIANCQWVDAQLPALLNENFNSISSGVPAGWDNSAYTCSSSYRWQSDVSGYNGTRGMKFNTYSASSNTYSLLKTPVLNLNAPYTLKFKYQNYNAGTFNVRISLDGGATYNTVLEDGLTTASASEWGEKEISLAAYSGQSNVRIVFYCISNYGSQRQYLDDVVIESAPTCKAPEGLFVTNLMTTSADVNWGLSVDGDYPTTYQVTVSDEHGNTVLTDKNVPGASSSYQITGLTPNTTYSVRMRSDCSSTLGGNSKYGSITFTTACIPTNLPYTENFDALTGIPGCTYSLNASIDIGTKYGTSGKSLKLSTTANDNAYMIFPSINHAANDLQMTFFARSSVSNPVTFMVGIVSDPADIEGTFEPLFIDSLASSAGWKEVRMNTANASVSSSPIALCVYVGGGQAANYYIDNVSVVTIPTCVRPEQFRAYNPTDSSADLTWTLNNAPEYLIDVISENGDTTVFHGTTNPCTVTGLDANTEYSFRLRGVCTPGDTSEYATATATITTLCEPMATTMWAEDADKTSGSNLPECWTYGYFTRATTGTSYDQPFQTQNSTAHSGSRGFQLRSMSTGNYSFLTSPGFTVDQANVYQASIWVYRPAGTSYNGEGLHLYASNSPDNITNAQDLGLINRCAGNSPVEADGAGWYKYEFPITKTGVVYLIIEGISMNGNSTYFDDVEIGLAPTCNKPGDIVAGAPTDSSIAISWTPGVNNETSWALVYQVTTGGVTVSADSLVVTSPNYNILGISSSSTYTLKARVYAICSPTDMSAAKKLTTTFTTPCGVIANFPYIQDFEGGTMPPYCWSQQQVSSSPVNNWQTSTSQKHGGNYSAYIPDKSAGAKTALISGELSLTNPAGYQVSFWMYRSASYQTKTDEAIHVYIAPTDTLDEATAVELGVVNQNYQNAPAEAASGWYQYTFDVPLTVTGTQYVSFCYHNQYGTGAYIDDVMIRVAPTCRDMAAPTISDIQPNSAKVTVSDTASAWDLSYVATGGLPVSGTIVNVTGTNNYVITGLTANQTYDVYVRRNCGTEVGAWSLTPVTFTALCTDLYADVTDVNAYYFAVKTDASAWEISYGPLGTTAGGGTVLQVTGDSIAITGLTPATDYVFYVRRDCGSSVYSDWSYSYSVKTTIVPDSIPFATGFEDPTDDSSWTIAPATGNNNFIFGTSTDAVASGSRALYISDGTGYYYNTGSSSKTYAYRTIYFESDVHHISFRWKCTGGESTWDFGRVMLVPASEALVGGTGSSFSSTTFPNATYFFDPEGKNFMNLTTGDENGWNLYDADFDMTGKAGTYNLVIMWSNDASAGTATYPLSIDNINVSRVSCHRPTILSSGTTSTSTTINVSTQTATEWEVVVSTTPIDIFDTVAGDIYQQITSAPVALTGLTANTPYYYTARAICGPNDTSDWAEVQIVRTLCDAMNVPYTENFEDNGALNCWPSFGNVAPSIVTAYKYAGTASCKITDASAVSPTFNVSTLANQMLNGWAYSTSDSAVFSVGVMVDPEDVSTFEALGQVMIPARNTWTEFTTYFTLLYDPDYADFYNAQHFVIVVGADAIIYVDNLYLGLTPTCPKPTEVAVTNVLARTFDIAWTENGTATSWRVKAVPATPGQATVDTVVTTNPASISGLQPASPYSIQIQAICSATDTSLITECGSIFTACDIVTAPWEETFDFMTAQELPLCWDNSATTASASQTYYKWGVYEYNSNKMLYMCNYWCQSGNVITNSPIVNLPAGHAYTFDFDYCHQSSAGDMTVSISSDGGSTWNPLGTYSRGSGTSYTAPGDWTTVSIDITSYAGNNVMVRFSSAANYGSGSIFLDNVKIMETRSCQKPTGLTVVGTPTSNSVQLSWTAGGTETSWQVRAISAAGTTYEDVTTTSCTLTGLNPATLYSVSVAAVCGVGDSSFFSAPVAFTTACMVVNPPVYEDFQSFTLGSTPTCWDISSSTTSTAASTPAYIFGVVSAGGNNMLRYYDAGTYDDGDAILVSPEYNLSATAPGYTLLFDYSHQAQYCGALSVEISTNGGTSWTQIGSYPYNAPSSSATTVYTMTTASQDITAYKGNTVKVRFLVTAAWYTGAIFLDNFRLIENRSCSDVQGLRISASDTVATVTIQDSLASHSQWQYLFGPAGFDTTGVAPTLVADSVLTFTGLTGRTTYDIYVRAYCDIIEQSYWLKKSFTTTSIPASMPYICQFTDSAEIAQWSGRVSSSTANHFTIGNDPQALSPGQTRALYVTNGSSYAYTTSNGSASAAYRLFYMDDAPYNVSFLWKCTGGESAYDYGRFYFVPATEPVFLPTIGYYQADEWPADMIALDGDGPVNLHSPEWNTVDQIIDFTGRSGSYFLVFVWTNDGSVGTSNYPLAINDIRISEVTCPALRSVAVPDSLIGPDSVRVVCSNSNPGGTFSYWINTTGIRSDSLAYGASVDSAFTITGLNPSTRYYLYVVSHCTADDVSAAYSTQFTTECGAITTFPYTEGFEGDFAPACWTASAATTANPMYWDKYTTTASSSNYIHSGRASAHIVSGITGNTALLATPEFSFDSLREYNVSFYMYRASSTAYTDAVQVYLSDDPNTVVGATLLNTTIVGGASSAGNYQVSVDLPMGTSGSKYIVFVGQYNYYGYVYIDDVTVDVYPVCRDLNGVTVDATTATTITVSSNKGPNHQGILFAYAPSTATSVADTIGSVYSTTGTAVITGLTNNTTYKIFAIGLCADDDSTAWTNAAVATTQLTDCFAPQNLRIVGSVQATSATFTWGTAPDAIKYEYIIGGVTADTVADTLTITGLIPAHNYRFSVRTICADDTSAYSYVDFTTPAVPAPLPYLCDFEDPDENSCWNILNGGLTNAFAIGSATSNGGVNSLYVSNDGGNTNAYTISSTSVVFATRLFHLEPGQYAFSYDWQANGESSFDYCRVFLAPYSMTFTPGTLPTSVSTTGVPAGAIALDNNNKLNLGSGWENFAGVFSVTTEADFNMVIMWRNDGSVGSNPPIGIDNVEVRALTCPAPSAAVIASTVTENSASVKVVTPVDNDTIIYAVSTSSFDNAFFTDTIIGHFTDTLHLTNLPGSSSINVYVRRHCAEGDESFNTVVSFRTSCGTAILPYNESFETITNTSKQIGAVEAICWNDLNVTSASYPYYITSTSYVTDGTRSIEFISSNTTPLYLVLPSFGDNVTSCRVTYDVAYESMTASGKVYVGYLTNPSVPSSFVSLYTSNVPTTYTMTSQIADIANIPAGARLAFKYGDAGSSYFYAWVDNVHVFQIVSGPTYNETICYDAPYTNYGFNVPAENIAVGQNTFTRTKSGVAGAPDTLITANVNKLANIQTIMYDTLCQGQPLVWEGHTIAKPISRPYTLPTFTAACGCDSTVIKVLTVLPTYTELFDTICQGDSYSFKGQTLTQPGVYFNYGVNPRGCNDTTKLNLFVVANADTIHEDICKGTSYTWYGQSYNTTGIYTHTGTGSHGCPLTEYLDLKVLDGDSTMNITICQGGQYLFRDTVITTAGTYVRSFYDVTLGCNITITLNASVAPALVEHVYDYACEGKPYANYGVSIPVVTQDTVYIKNTRTQSLCDSTAYIHLTYTRTVTSDTTAYIKTGETIEWNGTTYNQPGVHSATFASVVTGCDSVVTLTIINNDPVENVADVHMTIVPNPVNAGATSFVYGEFGEIEKVEILNNFGQLVDRFVPETYPIEVSGISAAGLYYVRVTTKTGSVHIQKLIVK